MLTSFKLKLKEEFWNVTFWTGIETFMPLYYIYIFFFFSYCLQNCFWFISLCCVILKKLFLNSFSQRFKAFYRTKSQIYFGQVFTDQWKVSFCETTFISFNPYYLLFNFYRPLNNARRSRIDVNHLHSYNNFTAIKINKNLPSKSSFK